MRVLDKLLNAMSVSRKYIGRDYVISAVKLALEDKSVLHQMTKNLYPQLAKIHSTSPMSVERNIRTVSEVMWRSGDRQIFEQIAGHKLSYRPTNSELIDYLAYYVETHSK